VEVFHAVVLWFCHLYVNQQDTPVLWGFKLPDIYIIIYTVAYDFSVFSLQHIRRVADSDIISQAFCDQLKIFYTETDIILGCIARTQCFIRCGLLLQTE